MKTAAIYARVSTGDQNPEMQLRDLRRMAKQRGFGVWKEYVDKGESGGKTSRPALDEMLKDAQHGHFNVLLVWKLDRLGRSLIHLVKLFENFKAWNVQLVSYGEGLDFTTEMGKLYYHLLGAFAEFEKGTIKERVKAGLRNARAKGKRLGRPPLKELGQKDIEAIRRERRTKKTPYAKLAAKFGINVWRAYNIAKPTPKRYPRL